MYPVLVPGVPASCRLPGVPDCELETLPEKRKSGCFMGGSQPIKEKKGCVQGHSTEVIALQRIINISIYLNVI